MGNDKNEYLGWIGAIRLNRLIGESLELRRVGERKRSFRNIIEVIVQIVFPLGIYIGNIN